MAGHIPLDLKLNPELTKLVRSFVNVHDIKSFKPFQSVKHQNTKFTRLSQDYMMNDDRYDDIIFTVHNVDAVDHHGLLTMGNAEVHMSPDLKFKTIYYVL